MSTLLGNKTLTKEYLSKCIYIVGMGNNDYINNYLLPQLYSSSHMYNPEQFASILIQQYSEDFVPLRSKKSCCLLFRRHRLCSIRTRFVWDRGFCVHQLYR
ncbi:hypothetical protein RDI58_004937 [Solanum bulbocastanum]|uniref:Uncharacterized protein n=1 Tax=Solanum bulbocastanum TaxID=147425 RepID=A0AAN8TZJ3_SOLBU